MILLIIGLIVGFIFTILAGKIRKSAFHIVKEKLLSEEDKAKLKELYNKDIITLKEYRKKLGLDKLKRESFDLGKFKKIFDWLNPVEWIKSLKEMGILDTRKWLIYAVIIGCIYGYGWYKGRLGKPVEFNLAYEKEIHMKLDGHWLVKPKNSQNIQIQDANGKVLKTIRAKDIPELQKKLKPYGFQLKPIFITGFGIGNKSKYEAGLGVSFLKWYKWRLETFISSCPAIYLGNSYQITDNSGAGIGVGKGLQEGDNRVIIYYKFEF